jgi:hypothetical protein
LTQTADAEVDCRHLAAALGDLDAVADHDAASVDPQRLGEQPQHRPGPQRCDLVELHGGAVEVIHQLIVEARLEVQRAHEAGDAEQFGAHGEACDGGGEPEKGAQAGERRTQQPDRIPPGEPQ